MSRPVYIVHFQPLELYPPIMNLILFLAKQQLGEIIIYTTKYNQSSPIPFKIESSLVTIRRVGTSGRGIHPTKRYKQYIKFYATCFINLLKSRPDSILYFETLSSFPVYLYKKFINRNANILVHYHEYTSKGEYTTGMKLVNYFHGKEQWLYPKLSWLSHTNSERMLRFRKDEQLVNDRKFHIMPNYPPKDWQFKSRKKGMNLWSIVYIGAVSRETMYFENFINWLMNLNTQFKFDIFSYNVSDEDEKWIQQLGVSNIRIHKGIEYFSIPELLNNYDIGVILYKGHSPNYVLNAPNKLFEYLICGLDVWVPKEMTGCIPYYTKNVFPQVLPLNFENLESFNWVEALKREGMTYVPSSLYSESVYPEITKKLYAID